MGAIILPFLLDIVFLQKALKYNKYKSGLKRRKTVVNIDRIINILSHCVCWNIELNNKSTEIIESLFFYILMFSIFSGEVKMQNSNVSFLGERTQILFREMAGIGWMWPKSLRFPAKRQGWTSNRKGEKRNRNIIKTNICAEKKISGI